MSITKKMRKAFDACTVMAGVEPDFECVYITKDAALLYLDEIDAENAKLCMRVASLESALEGMHLIREMDVADNAKLRELVRDLWLTGSLCDTISDMRLQAKGGDWRTMQERVDEALGIEVTE